MFPLIRISSIFEMQQAQTHTLRIKMKELHVSTKCRCIITLLLFVFENALAASVGTLQWAFVGEADVESTRFKSRGKCITSIAGLYSVGGFLALIVSVHKSGAMQRKQVCVFIAWFLATGFIVWLPIYQQIHYYHQTISSLDPNVSKVQSVISITYFFLVTSHFLLEVVGMFLCVDKGFTKLDNKSCPDDYDICPS